MNSSTGAGWEQACCEKTQIPRLKDESAGGALVGRHEVLSWILGTHGYPRAAAHACNPGTEVSEAGEVLGLTGQAAYLNQATPGPVRDHVLENKAKSKEETPDVDL